MRTWLCIILVFTIDVSANADGLWTSYTDMSKISYLAAHGDYIWGAIEGGTILRMDRHYGNFEKITMKGSIASDQINAIAVDLNGVVWFGTSEGLSRFDGISWTTYTTDNGLEQNNISGIAVDSEHRLWVIESSEDSRILQSFDGTDWETHIKNTGNIAGAFFSAVGVDDSNNVFIGGNSFVYEYGDGLKYWGGKEDTPISLISSIAFDMDGIMWCASDSCISKFDGSTWTKYTAENSGLLDHNVHSVAVDNKNAKWFGTDNGLTRYRGKSWDTFTSEGMMRFDGTKWSTHTYDTGLPDNHANALTVDDDGNVWVGTDRRLCRFDGMNFTIFPTVPENNIMKVVVDHENHKWFIAHDGAWDFDGKEWYKYTFGNSNLRGSYVNTVNVADDGSIWVGTSGGASQFDGESWVTFHRENSGLQSSVVDGIAFDRDGGTWFSTYGTISFFDGETWSHYPVEEDSRNDITCMAVDHDNYKWFGTVMRGLMRFDGTSWRTYNRDNSGLECDGIYSIAIAPDGTRFFGTCRELSEFNGSNWKIHPEVFSAHAIDFDREGYMWAANDHGFFCYDGENWVSFRNYQTSIGENDDFESDNINKIHDLAVDKDGVIWIATTFGIYSFTGEFIMLNRPLGDEVLQPGSTLEISWMAPRYSEVKLDYSLDNGITWQEVYVSLDAKERSYSWTIPDDIIPDDYFTAKISIRVSSADNPEKFVETSIIVLSQKYQNAQITYNPENSGLLSPVVTTMFEDSRGVKWFGTDRGISRFDYEFWQSFTPENSPLVAGYVNDCAEGHDGTLWFATNGGLSWYKGYTWETWFEGKNIIKVAVDGTGNVWIVCQEKVENGQEDFEVPVAKETYHEYYLLYRFDGKEWIQVTGPDSNIFNSLYAFEVSPAGDIWLWANDMLMSYKDDTWNIYPGVNGVYPSYPTLLTWDHDGVLWTNSTYPFTWKSNSFWYCPGIYSFDGVTWTNYTTENSGLVSNWINSISVDENGALWCASNYGLSIIHGDSWRTFSPENGWTIGPVNSLNIDRENVKWFVQPGGVTRFDELVVSNERSNIQPVSFALKANYPNPFNISTTISFSLSEDGFINLTVFNIMGQKVRELVVDRMNAGTHSVVWDGRNDNGTTVSSGIYITRLKAESQTATGKMLLLK